MEIKTSIAVTVVTALVVFIFVLGWIVGTFTQFNASDSTIRAAFNQTNECLIVLHTTNGNLTECVAYLKACEAYGGE